MKQLLVFITCSMIILPPAYAKEKKKTSAETAPKAGIEMPQKTDSKDWLDIEITTSEQELIKKYFQDTPQGDLKGHKVIKEKKLPPGLQKKAARGGDLPPGWQKKIARGEVLDAEVYQHATHLPGELTKRLPPAPEGTVLIKVEGKIIRLYEATRTILDVFDICK